MKLKSRRATEVSSTSLLTDAAEHPHPPCCLLKGVWTTWHAWRRLTPHEVGSHDSEGRRALPDLDSIVTGAEGIDAVRNDDGQPQSERFSTPAAIGST